MATSEGAKLSQVIRQKLEELKKLCKGLDEETASRAPSGRWSPKQRGVGSDQVNSLIE